MKITKYRTELNNNRHNALVKESAVNYACDRLDNPNAIVTMFNNVFGLNHIAEVETMFYVRETPWHGLGTRVEEGTFVKRGFSGSRT